MVNGGGRCQNIPTRENVLRTKVDDVEHLCALALCDSREQLPVRTRRDTHDGRHVRAIMFDKLDPRLLLLPQLEVSIDRSRDDEVRAVHIMAPTVTSGRGTVSLHSRPSRATTHRVTTTKLITSRCMKLLWYRSALGRWSRKSRS